ncbi:MAG: AAA domain-containing protein, partial [Weeksellaceae bacterium]|nr:AAA domain-containing protein [Weeksellaceae bacterium]
SIEQNSFSLKTELLKDYPNNTLIWSGRLNRTKELLSELAEIKLKELDRSIEISYPEDKSLIQLKNDAQTLLKYLNEGNNLSGILFNLKKSLLPRDIKEKLYFIDEVKINGSPCDTANEFQKVLNDIKIKQDFEELRKIWRTEKSIESLSYYDIFQFFNKVQNDFESLLSLLDSFKEVKSKVEISSSLKIDAYDSKIIEAAREEINFNILIYRITLLKNKIDNTLIYLSDKNIHPIAQNLINDIKKMDALAYERDLLKIDDAILDKADYNKYKTLQNSLQNIFPNLISEIVQGIFNFSNIELLQNAIYFKQALNELAKLLDKDYETELSINLIELESKQDKLIEKIASKKAWLNVVEKLKQNFLLRQHLQAWVAAVKKIGKTGKGKRALKFRKIAQNEMEMCKDSVPCWIMPLYKVAETIKPEKAMYDYVIIDEASQIGPDAIFLLYISKNIIIVGDDKQVSPEYVGVDANTMTPYIHRHLQNIPFNNFYGTEFSFFDHAKWFCKGMIVLREHFRCMPEIIEFSNKHFYAPDGKGLYPLKQYSENRLEPLKKVFCPNGYIEGQYQNIINKVEAEKIADTIYDLLTDKKYDNKTFGVITLQGNKQSAIIESMLLKKIGEKEFHNRKIVCGNSASFQGDERDIIFLSLVTAHNHNRAALVKPEDERRFNVAVSRAKEQIWLFHSVQIEDLSNTNDLRYKLLDHFHNHKPTAIPSLKIIERKPGSQPEPFESWFEVDVYNDIVSKGFGVIPQYKVAKGRYRIDLVAILNNGIKIAIECDGDKYHDAEHLQNDLMRQRVLERCGWQFFRIRGFEYYSNRWKALEPLWEILNTNNGNEKFLLESSYQHITKEENLFDIKNNSEDINSEFEAKSIITNQNHIDSFNQSEILVFTSHQNVYKVKKKEINDRLQILENIDFEPNEKTIYMTKINDYSGHLIVGFENGKVGKITISSYRTEFNRKKLKNAFSDESKLIFIERIENDVDLVALSSINKVVIFNTSQINPVESRTTKGVQVMKPKDGSRMIKIKKLNETKISDQNYYRKDNNLNVVGYYLKPEDKI